MAPKKRAFFWDVLRLAHVPPFFLAPCTCCYEVLLRSPTSAGAWPHSLTHGSYTWTMYCLIVYSVLEQTAFWSPAPLALGTWIKRVQ